MSHQFASQQEDSTPKTHTHTHTLTESNIFWTMQEQKKLRGDKDMLKSCPHISLQSFYGKIFSRLRDFLPCLACLCLLRYELLCTAAYQNVWCHLSIGGRQTKHTLLLQKQQYGGCGNTSFILFDQQSENAAHHYRC